MVESSQPETRRSTLLDRVREDGFCTVAGLAGELAVSEMTVRRDARRLAAAGAVRLVHGGISLPPAEVAAAGFTARAGVGSAAKRRIGRAAAALVDPADTLAVDAGTTAYALVEVLPAAFAGSVVTHSLPVMSLLAGRPGARCVGLGGDLYAPSRAFVGPATVEAAAGVRARWCFLGAAAVDGRGCYGAADVERPAKAALMAAADRTVLLVEARKFRASEPVLLARPEELYAVVTDAEPPAATGAALTAAGVAVIVAPGG